MEKQNKAARQKKKKEETARLRSLVGVSTCTQLHVHVHSD